MADKAIELALEVHGTSTALDCTFRNANRAKSRHAHISQLCWCSMACDGVALFIDSWSLLDQLVRPPYGGY